MRCPECGTNWNDPTPACPGCGATVQSTTSPFGRVGGAARDIHDRRDHDVLAPSRAAEPLAERVGGRLVDFARGGREVFGEVLCIEHVTAEHPDFDWCRFLARVIWFGVFVLLPLAALHVVLTQLGPLSVLLAVFALWMLVKFLMPQNLWAFIHMASVLNPFGRRHEATIPVRHLRVRTPEGWQVMVRMKGRPLRGTLMQDDEATFFGDWRDGVLFSKRAFVHGTQSWVELEGAYAWAGLAAAVIVLIALAYYLHLAVSNVTQQLPDSVYL